MHVVVSGSSGLVGGALLTALHAAGHQTTALVRRDAGPGEATWDPGRQVLDQEVLVGVDAVVNLSGAGIGDRRWTTSRRAVILSSRVAATQLLARTMAETDRPPAVMVNASAVGFYGDRGNEELTEDSAPGTGFLAEVCRQWEAATRPAETAGIRVVHLRSGIVLARRGGALARQLHLFRPGVGGRLGTGRQWLSWISLDDEVGAIVHLLSTSEVSGPVNVTAPEPVTNAAFTRALGRALHRPAVIAVPRFALAAGLGRGIADEMILASQRALPVRLTAAGYAFRHTDIVEALTTALSR